MSMDGLSVKQERAMEVLLEGGTQKEAATVAGVAADTVGRWLREDEEFETELEGRREEQRAAKAARMDALEDAAISTLRELMGSKNEMVRLRAAAVVMRRLRDMPQPVEESEFERARNEALDRLSVELGIPL